MWWENAMAVEVVTGYESLREGVGEWRALVHRSRLRNIFYEPEVLLPAIQFLTASSSKVRIVLVKRAGELIGLFPISIQPSWRGLPMSYVSLWKHPYQFLSTPLVDHYHYEDAIEQFLGWLIEEVRYPRLFECSQLSAEFCEDRRGLPGVLNRLHLQKALYYERRPAFFIDNFESFELFWANCSRAFRKKYRQRYRRLSESGTVLIETLPQVSEIGTTQMLNSWIEDFLILEESGWKGREGTAIRSQYKHRQFFVQTLHELYKREKLHFMRLRVNGETVAGKVTFTTGSRAFCFKIAYREEFSRCSPGLLLEVEFIREMLRSRRFSVVDSCATPNHPLFESIWDDSIGIASGMLYRGRVFGTLRALYCRTAGTSIHTRPL
jgi:CelD/BcsL family acetyltransferase involved in cellulose biosynthesis